MGDVYDRAWKGFVAVGRTRHEGGAHSLARIAAVADRERAFRDFTNLITKGPVSFKQEVAVYTLGHVANDQALGFLLNLLEQGRFPRQTISALDNMLAWKTDPARISWVERAWLLEKALPGIKKALAGKNLPEEHKRELRSIFREFLEDPPTIDLDKATKVLLDPDEKVCHGWAEGQGYQLYETMVRASDPKVIPLLAQVLRQVPAASGTQAYSFHKALVYYAGLCPNAMKKELAKHRLDQGTGRNDGRVAHAVAEVLPALLSGRELNPRRPFPKDPAAYLEQVLAKLESADLEERRHGREDLEWLFFDELGFDPYALAPARAAWLEKMKPELKKLGKLAEPELRSTMLTRLGVNLQSAVLTRLGVNLEGRPNRQWLPALRKAALSLHPAVAQNALRLIELITDQKGCYELFVRPPAERERALTAFLEDRGIR